MWTLLTRVFPIATTAIEPYLIWVKLSIAIVLLACSFLAGVRWESAAVNALLLKQERAARDWQALATKNAQEILDAQIQNQAEKDRLKLEATKKLDQQRAAAARSAYEYWNNNPQANIRISNDLVGMWNAANPGGAAQATTPPTSSKTDAGAGTCALADLYSSHEQLIYQHEALRSDLIELQAWARDALSICNAPAVHK